MPDYARIAEGAARAGLSVMRDESHTPELVDKLVDTLHELAHAVNERVQAGEDPKRLHLPVCKKGCGWCCHTDVTVTVPEVLRIARHLRATRSPETLAALREGLSDLAARTREMTSQEWKQSRIPCPFLDVASMACTIHEVRPATCRAYNSVNLSQCVKQYETGDENVPIPANMVQQRANLAIGVGLTTACRAHDLEWEWLTLTAGLAAALERPDAAEAWLAGERPFKNAHTKLSRTMASRNTADVDTTLRRLRTDHQDELPARASAANEDLARRERNRKKRQRKGR